MKTCLRIILLAIMPVGFLSCSVGKSITPMGFVPSNSAMILSARWQEVCQDAKLKSLVKGQEIETVLSSIGLNSTGVTRLVLFSDGFNSTSSDFGIILSGSYKSATVINTIQSRGWGKQSYKGVALYGDSSGNQFLAVLKGNLLVIGTRGIVESTIDVLLNPKNAFTNKKPFNQLAAENSYAITIVLSMSQEAQDMNSALMQMSSFLLDIAEMGPLGDLLNTIGFARALSCSVSRKGAKFPVEIKAVMKDENSASFISGSLNLLKGTSKLVPRDRMSVADRERIDRFQDLQITRNGETLSIKMNLNESDISR